MRRVNEMIPDEGDSLDSRLNYLLGKYRDACEPGETSRNFMPALWQRIEAKRSRALRFERAARSLFAAAVGLSLVLGAFLIVPTQQPSAFNSSSFVEELATDETAANGAFFEPVRLELTSLERHRR